MTPDVPAFDQGNTLLAETPASLSTALMATPAGQRMVLTVRTTSATVTVLLSPADAKAWAAAISREAAGMSASGLIIAPAGSVSNGKAADGG